MADLAGRLEGARAKLANKSDKFFPDLCSLVVATSVPDGFGGTVDTTTTIASGIPCKYEAGTPMQVQIGGGQVTTLAHRITMGATATTLAIRPHYQIIIEAHHNTPQLTFENPVLLTGSMNVFAKVAAALASIDTLEPSALFLESGFALLLESGDQILLEA